MSYVRVFCLGISLLSLFLYRDPVIGQQAPVREITRIAEDLYRFRNAGHFSVFLVTFWTKGESGQ